MSDQPLTGYEAKIAHWATSFPYPETPDIASSIGRRQPTRRPLRVRLVWAALLLILISAGMMAVPPIRAAVVDFLQVGAIRIWRVEPTPAPTPQATPLPSILDLAGETTLFQARAQVDFPIYFPPIHQSWATRTKSIFKSSAARWLCSFGWERMG